MKMKCKDLNGWCFIGNIQFRLCLTSVQFTMNSSQFHSDTHMLFRHNLDMDYVMFCFVEKKDHKNAPISHPHVHRIYRERET